MAKELADTAVARQNILNNSLAIAEIQKAVGIKGVLFENEYKFLKRQIANFFNVTERTIDNCIERNNKELSKNGYEVLKGNRLIDFKLVYEHDFGNETDFVTKTTVLGIFNFRTFLNIAMLLNDSEKARQLRSLMLDIVIDTINKRTGGNTKYINQRDEDYIINMMRGEDYRKEFTNALRDCVDMENISYHLAAGRIDKDFLTEIIHSFLENENDFSEELKLKLLLAIDSQEVGINEK